ncbi:AAA family ATPase [Macrococcus lamae]|nr:AAA family ATPase [Macrococcus lamae]
MTNKIRVIWINGAFGAGKTTIAEELQRALPNSYLFDPEQAASFINHVIPSELKLSDFQDYQEWRKINRLMLNKLVSQYSGVIIIPMTITNEKYYYEITRDIDQTIIKRFLLVADKETLKNRLITRGDYIGSWPYQQIDRCLRAFNQNEIWQPIKTIDQTVDVVVSSIIEQLKIEN